MSERRGIHPTRDHSGKSYEHPLLCTPDEDVLFFIIYNCLRNLRRRARLFDPTYGFEIRGGIGRAIDRLRADDPATAEEDRVEVVPLLLCTALCERSAAQYANCEHENAEFVRLHRCKPYGVNVNVRMNSVYRDVNVV